ncbi:eukaryotic translation initiation factor 4E type 2 [Gregarina niphandrodes]|uniref:Eukaryotic translation initiation factor 4E type 2 n=1 Tax=Gregarina niphandrodes TaxID=110365 RepID=A0A023BD01_GRENI|nr:eukaryotic translation initiation factor 4E type 2 [Gregarina niphandrodes]EZG86780.1 eukaryotic translation initiation factor 4E type 2 [Gregarina niphandrodes]|eukprot:XP_011128736.1 eukaryotic translation initiation factor 4E type 2 [Gregarina niphandrodes]
MFFRRSEVEQLPMRLSLKLSCNWTLWYTNASAKTTETFEQCLIPLGSVSTAEAFWALYSHCIRPSNLPKGTEYHLFREGIRPMWEDEANANGSTLLLRLKRGYIDYCWEALLLALIGGQLGPEANGAVAGRRFTDDHLSLWSSKFHADQHQQISANVCRLLGLKEDSPSEYKSHAGTLERTTVIP